MVITCPPTSSFNHYANWPHDYVKKSSEYTSRDRRLLRTYCNVDENNTGIWVHVTYLRGRRRSYCRQTTIVKEIEILKQV